MDLPRSILPLLTASLLLSAGCRRGPAADQRPLVKESIGTENPDLLMDTLRIQYFDAAGLEWIMEAPKARGFTTKNLMTADNLTVAMYEGGVVSSSITANQGTLNTASDSPASATVEVRDEMGVKLNPGDMFLTGNVVVISTDGTKIETDWLRFEKKRDLITSTAPVTILRPDSLTHGRGLEARPDFSSLKVFNETLVIKDNEMEPSGAKPL